MSRNYDNWERLVAAVLKREQIWQLCHQDSISSSIFSDDSSDLGLSLRFSEEPFCLKSFRISRTFKWIPRVGKGDFGTTIIAVLRQDVRVSDQKCFAKGSKAAIKSLKPVKVTEDEFKQQMIVLGNCRHENVGQPQAYYYSDETKLIVYDYYAQGSVSDMLHGANRGRSPDWDSRLRRRPDWDSRLRRRPDWDSRLRIAIGAARGIAHIHTQLGGTMVHGNIKSSNIFLNSQQYGCVSDFGLAEIMESSQSESQSQMSDVYSFGQLLLELVTHESLANKKTYSFEYILSRLTDYFEPNNYGLLVDEIEMADAMRERFPFVDLDVDVFYVQQGLHDMLLIAKRCLAKTPTSRPTMSDVVLMLQNIYKKLWRRASKEQLSN